MAGVRFVLGVHGHQPVGNFPEVFSEAYRRSYVPFLDVLSEFPQIPFAKRRFGVTARGMWLAERVWEPHLARPLAEAGVEYVILEDNHCRSAGLSDEDLTGYYLTLEVEMREAPPA